MQKNIITLIVLLAIVGGIYFLESRRPGTGSADVGNTDIMVSHTMTAEEKAKEYTVAKEISTPDAFINTDGISIQDEINKGHVVLVDFWTYSCINCQRTLPYLNDWYKKYADDGLVIIGIHTPEFEFEKDLANVQKAVDKFDIKFPVVLDNDYSTWRAYGNRNWPHKYLVDVDGFIVYDHIGEGDYEKTEEEIVKALNEAKQRRGETDMLTRQDMAVGPDNVQNVDFTKIQTPETYLGYQRAEYNTQTYTSACRDAVCEYTGSTDTRFNSFTLGGSWNIGGEQAVLTSSTGTLTLRFNASKVNLVAEALNSSSVPARILLDGMPIGARGGADVKDSMVTFNTASLYNLVDLGSSYEEHVLTIEFRDNTEGLGAFAFTFG